MLNHIPAASSVVAPLASIRCGPTLCQLCSCCNAAWAIRKRKRYISAGWLSGQWRSDPKVASVLMHLHQCLTRLLCGGHLAGYSVPQPRNSSSLVCKGNLSNNLEREREERAVKISKLHNFWARGLHRHCWETYRSQKLFLTDKWTANAIPNFKTSKI